MHIVVATPRALQKLHAFSAQTEDLIRLRAGRNSQRFGPVDRVRLDLRAEDCLADGDRLFGVDVVIAAGELLMVLDGDEDVEIAGRAAVVSRLPLRRHAQARAFVDTGGNLYRQLALLA